MGWDSNFVTEFSFVQIGGAFACFALISETETTNYYRDKALSQRGWRATNVVADYSSFFRALSGKLCKFNYNSIKESGIIW